VNPTTAERLLAPVPARKRSSINPAVPAFDEAWIGIADRPFGIALRAAPPH
jgi:hypothetical protein